MKREWLVWSMAMGMAMALALAPIAWRAWAQEPPAADPAAVAAAEERDPGDLEGMDELGGLDILLAADVAAGPGPGPGGAMGPGPGGMGPGGRRGAGMGRGPGAQELREKLNLSADQKAKIADIRDRQVRAAIPIQGDLRIAGLDMRKLMRADKPDLKAIEAQIDRVSELRASLQKSRVASMLEARAVLTPAQQKLMREYGGRRGMGMLDGPGMGHGPEGRRMRMGR